MNVEIAGLWISAGHNFVGRHGLAPREHSAVPVRRIECAAGRGVRGDRYFDHRPDFKGQITFLATEVLEEVREALSLRAIEPGALRRNVLTRQVDLNVLIGQTFELGGILFAGIEECRPCHWMNRAVAPGTEVLLRGRGGLRASILTDGVLRTGNTQLHFASEKLVT